MSWLAIQQMLDSAIPIGGFAHSFGLETAVQEGRIRHSGDLEEFVGTLILQNWATADAMVVKAIYEDAPGGEWSRAFEIERLVHLQKISSESRQGAEKMGRRLLRLAASIHPSLDWSPMLRGYEAGDCLATHPFVHGFVSYRLGSPLDQAVQGYLYSCVVTAVGSALRLLSIGQTEGQILIARLFPLIGQGWKITQSLPSEDVYTNSPAAERYAICHETLYSRLFMS
ncbi:Urease accessory protein UreF [compost metagenome]